MVPVLQSGILCFNYAKFFYYSYVPNFQFLMVDWMCSHLSMITKAHLNYVGTTQYHSSIPDSFDSCKVYNKNNTPKHFLF